MWFHISVNADRNGGTKSREQLKHIAKNHIKGAMNCLIGPFPNDLMQSPKSHSIEG